MIPADLIARMGGQSKPRASGDDPPGIAYWAARVV